MYVSEEIDNSSMGKENHLLGSEILYTNMIGGKCDWKQSGGRKASTER